MIQAHIRALYMLAAYAAASLIACVDCLRVNWFLRYSTKAGTATLRAKHASLSVSVWIGKMRSADALVDLCLVGLIVGTFLGAQSLGIALSPIALPVSVLFWALLAVCLLVLAYPLWISRLPVALTLKGLLCAPRTPLRVYPLFILAGVLTHVRSLAGALLVGSVSE